MKHLFFSLIFIFSLGSLSHAMAETSQSCSQKHSNGESHQCKCKKNKKKYKRAKRFVSFLYGPEVNIQSQNITFQGLKLSLGGDLSKKHNIGYFETGMGYFSTEPAFFVKYGYNFIDSCSFSFGAFTGLFASIRSDSEEQKEVSAENLGFGGDLGLSLSTRLAKATNIVGEIGIKSTPSSLTDISVNKENLNGYVSVGIRWNFKK